MRDHIDLYEDSATNVIRIEESDEIQLIYNPAAGLFDLYTISADTGHRSIARIDRSQMQRIVSYYYATEQERDE